MIKVSVIVPVYNVEKYLGRCLDSIVNQNFDGYEILVVNDGSPDNSQKIIDKYVKKYPKLIKSFIKENGGLSSARNYGLDHARGKYVIFTDSDDYLHEDYLNKMYSKITSDDFDVCVCDIFLSYPDGKLEPKDSLFDKDLLGKKDIMERLYDFYPIVGNKMFRRSLLVKENYFLHGVLYEDVEFTFRLFPKVKKIGVIKECLFHYYQNNTSIMHTFNKRLYDFVNNWDNIYKYYKDKKIYNEYKDLLDYSFTRYAYATFVKRATNFDYSDYKDALNYAIKKVNAMTGSRIKNKYYYKSIKGLYLLTFNKVYGILLYKILRLRG